MALKIANLNVSNPAPLSTHNVYLIDGVAGSGKTTFVGTVGAGKKILVIDLEGGTTSYSSPVFSTLQDSTEITNIDVISIPKDGEGSFDNAAKLALAIQSVFEHLIRTKNSEGYALVALDSIVEFQERFLDLHTANDPRQAYGAWKDVLYSLVHKMRAAPLDVVILSRPVLATEEVTGLDIVRSGISPAAWKSVSGLVDANGLLAVKTNPAGKTTRTLNFSPGQRYAAKTRLDLGEIEAPTFKKMLDLIAAGGKSPDGDSPVAPPKKPSKVPVLPRK